MLDLQRREALGLLAVGLPGIVSGCLGDGDGSDATRTGETSSVNTGAADAATNASSTTTGMTDGTATVTAASTRAENGGGTTTAGTTKTAPTGGGWTSTDWLPAPSALGIDGLYRFTQVEGTAIEANKQYIATDVYDFYKKALELQVKPTGIALSAMSMLLFQDMRVVTGEFTMDTVTERLKNSGYTKREDYKGYAIYKNGDTGHSVGLQGNKMVWNRNTESEDRAGTVDVAVDAKTGAVSRLAPDGSPVADLLEALGNGVLISGQEPEGQWLVQGSAVAISGDTTEIKDARVYESEDDTDLQQFEADLQQVEGKEGVQNISTAAEGRVTIATIVADTASYGSTVLRRLIA